MRQKTRNEKRQARARFWAAFFASLLLLIAITADIVHTAAAEPAPVSGEEYLAEIGASNEARAELAEVWASWEAEE